MPDQQTQLPPQLTSPVDEIPTAQAQAGPQEGVALCLSGGGFRAMLFHVGSFWRLNQAGLLQKLDRISSVSGGSITAGILGLNWNSLAFDGNGVAQKFEELLVKPIRTLASHTIDVSSILGGLLTGSISHHVADAYRKYLFGHKTLQDLPDKPRFVLNATNVQSKDLVALLQAVHARLPGGRDSESEDRIGGGCWRIFRVSAGALAGGIGSE